ncbi:barstar family protein [Hymenobacter edaphi]|uniref:barstar family protein n=1 Tax=Hymenobacter edaphi TaxID=2211146 RepID=UPI003C72C90E
MEFDGRFISTKAELHFDLYQQLQFPPWYGHNFDALNDCLRDWKVATNGTVFIFRNLNTLEPEHTNALLHILSMHSRRRLPYGQKLITLIQGKLLGLATTKPIGAINLYVWSGLESPGGYGNLLSESERP